MRCPGKALEKGLHVFVNQRMVVEHNGKIAQFIRRRQPAVDQQVGGLLERRFFGQLLHRNATVA